MDTVLRSKFARIPLLVSFVCTLLLWPTAHLLAQQSNPSFPPGHTANDLETRKIDLTLEDQPLADILKAVSTQIGHGIVMDGKPILSHASFTLHTSAKEALDRIAESFDCSWKVGKSGAILMSKRFHTPGDLPQIHLKEMQRMAADLLTIWPENACKLHLSRYPFITAPISPGNALYRTFTLSLHF